MASPILQFGTSRFLQAHVDLFVQQALESGQALGRITVVQTTGSAQSAQRVAAFNAQGGYPVRIRGRADGAVVEQEHRVTAIEAALQADHDWPAIRALAAGPVRVIVSNTGDRGYELSAQDGPAMLDADAPPRSFPAKLLVLLHRRYLQGAAPVTLYPCELVANNGSVLRELVCRLAREWGLDDGFLAYLGGACVWINSLVDRIVSEPIEPAGAVAEPYAIWVIEAQPGMVLPCTHPQIVVTEQLEPYERRKLFLLNLGHTFLAEQWLRTSRAIDETVLRAMADPDLRAQLEALWEEEVLPVFDALGEADIARAYLAQVRDRFTNPFLAHRLADIAQNHEQKKQRRLLPVVELAAEQGLALAQPRLRAALLREAA
ncbi:mannitol dehydrogenase family protein [Duganella sp. BJB488]|uniref:mannitol dehydrogenase family protein n=1 Tax=unclassified Duganella TaxID=2636909 RepID=UPI000E34628B|nr:MULTISPECIES: mannitol dehydrogenase family protein [unclassified Duganella]RFP17859.1 mannitol dehydrogenase family protein [Duganella sp. BJB489]RFP22365.1 mannitol dehydrogenase family protein [Duganella sp. BJB488]RFP37699.1 mannitol dehydrogenase family protein [Duganella sp. BJB480]